MDDSTQVSDAPDQTNNPRRRPILVWIVSAYSVIYALYIYAGFLDFLTSDPIAVQLPAHERFYVYMLPGILLFAGVGLFLLKKGAFALYLAFFLALLVVPIGLWSLYANLSSNWLEIYKEAAHNKLGLAWLHALILVGYSGFLYQRGVLK